MQDELVTQEVELPGGPLRVLQPRESAELPDDGPVEWAPLVPYWSVLWRSGVALAGELEREERRPGQEAALRGRRVIELGCGLAVPSLAAARTGARVLATDADPDALELVARNAELNGVEIETTVFDWTSTVAADELAIHGPFDLVLAADVLYERPTVARMLSLLPRLSAVAWLADPARPTAAVFLEQARERGWTIDSVSRGVIDIHRLVTASS
ncbi:MAG TPA: 50S ribosomal protein L11 methyltransferase [Thermoleophilaceae bacterium]